MNVFTKTYLTQLEDIDGEDLTFIIRVDYEVDRRGVTVVDYDFWPFYEDMRESVEDFIDSQK